MGRVTLLHFGRGKGKLWDDGYDYDYDTLPIAYYVLTMLYGRQKDTGLTE
jgi:hypothetical protein